MNAPDDFDPIDNPESIYEAAVFLGAVFAVLAIAFCAGVFWLLWVL